MFSVSDQLKRRRDQNIKEKSTYLTDEKIYRTSINLDQFACKINVYSILDFDTMDNKDFMLKGTTTDFTSYLNE